MARAIQHSGVPAASLISIDDVRALGPDARAAVDAWLDPALTDPEQALALLSVTDAASLEAYPVSTLVNSVQNNEPALLDPLPEDDPDPDVPNPEPATPPGQDRLL